MQFEYQALAVMTFIFLFAWLPSSVGKWKSFGWKWLASNRNPLPDKEMVRWGSRAERAHNNLKDYFPAFAVTIILLGQLAKFDECTSWAAGLFVAGRVLHMVAYIAGNVPLRALGFFIGLLSNSYLLVKIFQ